ncbi:MAG: hypothetical protein FJX25_08280 [Alphaproteobacteria bacterium]|nr:hypothetical protein [Alphaproteobacteria bacterium]
MFQRLSPDASTPHGDLLARRVVSTAGAQDMSCGIAPALPVISGYDQEALPGQGFVISLRLDLLQVFAVKDVVSSLANPVGLPAHLPLRAIGQRVVAICVG